MKTLSRRGVTLVELLIALTISAGLGGAVVALLTSTNRFEERAESQRSARFVARGAVNVLVNDLRLIDPAWGIDSASTSAVWVKAPYAIGMVCDTTGSLTVALEPADSVVFAKSGFSGFAWRATAGTYTAVPGGTLTTSSTFPASCTSAGIQQITAPSSAPNQKTINATVSGTSRNGIKIGSIVMLYRRVGFYFANSAVSGLTSRKALWRNFVDGAGAEEMAAPFDATAAFNFYYSSGATAHGVAPSPLTLLRGLQLFLPGESENTPRLRSSPEQSDLTTAVFFINAAT